HRGRDRVPRDHDRRGNPRADEREHLSLRRLSQHRRGHSRGCGRRWAVKPSTYERAPDAGAAIAAVSRPGAKFIAGGTNLIDLMRLEIEQPTHLVDISRLPLKGIEELGDGGIRIGAQALNSDTAAHPRVRTRYPLVS